MAWKLQHLRSWVPILPCILALLDIHSHFVNGAASPQEVEQHLELGKRLLGAGQLADALSHYHAAIDGDPTNYMSYFKRATVYLAMGKSKAALPDLTKVIELKADFLAARLQRGNVLLKQGRLDEAHIDYEAVLRTQPNNEEARSQMSIIEPLIRDIQEARNFIISSNFGPAIELLSKAIEACPWDSNLREMRAETYEKLGEGMKAIMDYKVVAKLTNDNTEIYLKTSRLYYLYGEEENSLEQVRECLKLDPDHKACSEHYKKVKKLKGIFDMVRSLIDQQRYDDCVSKAQQALQTESNVHSFVYRAKSHVCTCYSKGKKINEAIDACNEVLTMNENDIEALIGRAEAHITNERFEDAVNDYRKAHQVDQNNQEVQQGLNKAEKLLKQSQKRNYYKILGVRRTATKAEITKAYRRLAVKYHPDKYSGEDKKRAEKQFIDIAAAKEVLSDPEKRAKFDAGEDPLDPEAQQHQHGGFNPFAQGFNPFGGGGGGGGQGGHTFKFHFN